MENLREKKNEELFIAWKKICKWTKENCKGKFPDGERFHCPHHVYYWLDFVVNEQGDARIFEGHHGDHCPDSVVIENDYFFVRDFYSNNLSDEEIIEKRNGAMNFPYEKIEEIIKEWRHNLKTQILGRMYFLDDISDFEP